MKIALIFTLFFSVNTLTQAKELLWPQQESEVLRSIDNICADTWCGGEFDYSFNKLTCDGITGVCELSFEFINYIRSAGSTDVVGQERLGASCLVDEVFSYEDIIDEDSELVWSFYEKISDCISSKEDMAYNTFNL